jgi:hypothetical protein
MKLADIEVGETYAVSISKKQLLLPQEPGDFLAALRVHAINLKLKRSFFDRAKAHVLDVSLPYGQRQTHTGVLVEVTYKRPRSKTCPLCGHKQPERDEDGEPIYDQVPVQALVTAQQVQERWIEHEIDHDHFILDLKEGLSDPL